MKISIENLVNKVETDEFGRINGILAINKPAGITSHDVVDQVRKKLHTKRVGHAGALDPFATGVLIILIGKFTKLSDKLIGADKEYKAKVLFGVSTNTQDPEGEIIFDEQVEFKKEKVEKVLESFEGGYEQYVPVFSSVKVQGNKLRELARKSESFEISEFNGVKTVLFHFSGKDINVEIPKKKVMIENLRILDFGSLNKVPFKVSNKSYYYMDIQVKVSKGTYLRQLAEDIGTKLGVPAMLLELERTKVGEIGLNDCLNLDELTFS